MKKTGIMISILQGILLVLIWIGADFSPSYSTLLLFCGAFLLWISERIPEKKRIRILKCLTGTAGGLCLYPSLLVYTAQDDHFVMYCRAGVVTAILLQVLLEICKKTHGKKTDLFADRQVLLGAGFTALYSMFTSRALIPYAAGLFLLYILREVREEKRAYGLLASLFLLALFPLMPMISGTSLRGITDTLSSSRSPLAYLPDGGEKTLYANTGKVLEASEVHFLPGAVWLDTEGNPIQAHGGKI